MALSQRGQLRIADINQIVIFGDIAMLSSGVSVVVTTLLELCVITV